MLAFSEQKPYIIFMPSPNMIKTYVSGGLYHIYNRGVEKRSVFESHQDYMRFINYFEAFLGNRVVLSSSGIPYKKLSSEIELVSYCLMPNHIHLQIRQKTERGIVTFMQSLMTGYTMYFNLKYNRVGSLFQGTYKAVLAEDDSQVMETSRYIHRNPDQKNLENCLLYPYSSLNNYATGISPSWLTSESLTSYFASPQDYLDFCSRNSNLEVKPRDLRLSYKTR